tara:strand:+ start:306 stop:767 length:462 start_codon:yes stop_codon:yes gene_type:complete
MTPPQRIKPLLLEACEAHVQSRWEHVQKRINAIIGSLSEATKSSAGDKHETSRAMLQLDREHLGNQLKEIEKMQSMLQRIDVNTTSTKARRGSLVITEKASYFISVSIGAVTIEGATYFCLSSSAPMGQALLGKAEGQTITFNGVSQQIVRLL